MKNFLYRLLPLSILFALTANLEAQWFRVTEVAEKVWLIDDHQAANIYLVEGNDSALIIDTGIGVADLVSTVKGLTGKPLIVVNTHGHPDHCGANYQFDTLFPGHGLKIEAGFILDQIACVKSILDGTCESEPYESFAGNAMMCRSGRAMVAYNPENL